MQLYPVVMISVVLAADGGLDLGRPPAGWRAAAVAWVPVLVVVALAAGGVAWFRRRLAQDRTPGAVVAAERVARLARWLLLAHFAAAVLLFGWLEVVRGAVGDLVVVDELLTMLPAIAGLIGTWWAYYPVERRVREAVLLRQLDSGRAVFPLPTRGQYILAQTRLHLLFLLVPILLILAAAEAIDAGAARVPGRWWSGPAAADALTLAVAAGIVVLAPLLVRVVLEVEPLARGPLREMLDAVCRRHGVRVRGIAVWKTHGAMINAAVMGLVGRLRYVLLTDALLEAMTRRQVEAVMAHEVAHIRRRHMPWLLAALLAAALPAATALLALERRVPADAAWATPVTLLGALAAVLAAFGWVSRRFERQADAFAVRHVNDRIAEDAGAPPRRVIGADAVAIVGGALESIARLNAVNPERRSWRHGSVAWRRRYVEALAGLPADGLPIDRQVRRIKAAVAVVLVAALAWTAAGSGLPPRRGASYAAPAAGWPDDGPTASAPTLRPRRAPG